MSKARDVETSPDDLDQLSNTGVQNITGTRSTIPFWHSSPLVNI